MGRDKLGTFGRFVCDTVSVLTYMVQCFSIDYVMAQNFVDDVFVYSDLPNLFLISDRVCYSHITGLFTVFSSLESVWFFVMCTTYVVYSGRIL